jgi:hypothetical protein
VDLGEVSIQPAFSEANGETAQQVAPSDERLLAGDACAAGHRLQQQLALESVQCEAKGSDGYQARGARLARLPLVAKGALWP